jgi:lysophospholipase L1-like esterase
VVADSISIHYGPFLQQLLAGKAAYSRKEASAGGYDVSTDANGRDSSDVRDHLVLCLESGANWSVLLLNAGLHDARRRGGQLQTEFDVYRRNLIRIAQVAKKLAIVPVWIQTTPVDEQRHNTMQNKHRRYNSDIGRFNSIALTVMNEAGIGVLDISTVETDVEASNCRVDHVHYSEPLRRLQAVTIYGYLQSVLVSEQMQMDAGLTGSESLCPTLKRPLSSQPAAPCYSLARIPYGALRQSIS